jgi:hypothetical protein
MPINPRQNRFRPENLISIDPKLSQRRTALALHLLAIQARCRLTDKALAALLVKSAPGGEPQDSKELDNLRKRTLAAITAFLKQNKPLEPTLEQTLKETLLREVMKTEPGHPIREDLAHIQSLTNALYPQTKLTPFDNRFSQDQEYLSALGLSLDDINPRMTHKRIGGHWFVIRFSTDSPAPAVNGGQDPQGQDHHEDQFSLSLLNVTPTEYYRITDSQPERVVSATCRFSLRSRHRTEAEGNQVNQPLQTYRGFIIHEHRDITFFGRGSQVSKLMSMVWQDPDRISNAIPHGELAHGVISTGNANDLTVSVPMEACWIARGADTLRDMEKNETPDPALRIQWARDFDEMGRALTPLVGKHNESALKHIIDRECRPGIAARAIENLRAQRENTRKTGFHLIKPR